MYKKTLLNEINRNREIMGMKPLNKTKVTIIEQSFGKTEKKVVGKITSTEDLSIDVGQNNFEKGKYKISSLSQESQDKIKNDLKKIVLFLKENPNASITINLEVGESAVTNYDREKSECQDKNNKEAYWGDKCRLQPGDLAKYRGETLVNYIKEYFNSVLSSGVISKMPEIPEPKTNLGKQKYTYKRGVDKADDPKYNEDQYIKFDINVESTKTEEVVEERCLIDFIIDVSYHKERSKEFPCRGGHNCNQAEFDVFLNETLIGTANLNNRGGEDSGGDREAQFKVTEDLVREILIGNIYKRDETLILWTKCKSNNCHNSTQEVKLINSRNEVLYHKCVNPNEKRGDIPGKVLAIMDKCGNVKEDYEASDEEIASLSDTFKSTNEKSRDNEKQKLKERLGEEGYKEYRKEEVDEFNQLVESGSIIEFTNDDMTSIIKGTNSSLKIVNTESSAGEHGHGIYTLTVKNTGQNDYDTRLAYDGKKAEMYRIKPGQEIKTTVNYRKIDVQGEKGKNKFMTITLERAPRRSNFIQITEGPFAGKLYAKQDNDKYGESTSEVVTSYKTFDGVVPDGKGYKSQMPGRSYIKPNTIVDIEVLSKEQLKTPEIKARLKAGK